MRTYDGDMYDYILESGKISGKIIKERKKLTEDFVKLLSDEIEIIYITGAGTSNFSAQCVREFVEKLTKRKTFVVLPTEMSDNEYTVDQKTLVIGISATGASKNTINALREAKSHSATTLAFTKELESTFAKENSGKVFLDYGTENVSPKSKSYISEMLTIILCAIEYAYDKKNIGEDSYSSYITRLENTINNFDHVIKKSTEWYEKNAKSFKDCERMLFVGYEKNMGNIKEGALKVLECGRFQTSPYELEEFMHGIYHSINENCYIVFLSNKSQYFNRSIQLRNYLSGLTEHLYVICDENDYHDDKSLDIRFVDDTDFYPLEYIIPLHVLAYKIAVEKGINPNKPSDPLFHQKMNSKLV